MSNPFEALFEPRLENPQGEEVEGMFSCQTQGCYINVYEARYLKEVKILTWICPLDHISSAEMDLD